MDRSFNAQGQLVDPEEYRGTSITIIGAGATGSHVAVNLAQMGIGHNGCGEIKVWDFDVIEAHNINNQAFWPKHIGMQKVTALASMLDERFGVNIKAYDERVVGQREVQSNYVFLMTDTMSSRAEIMDNAMKYAINTDLVIETRMGLDDGRIYAFNPNDQDALQEWKDTLYSDDEADASLCGGSSSIVNTTQFVASLAVSRLIQHFRENKSRLPENTSRDKSPQYFECIFNMHPEVFMVAELGQDSKILS